MSDDELELVDMMESHAEALIDGMRRYRDLTGHDITGVTPTAAIDRLRRQLTRKKRMLTIQEKYSNDQS